MRVERSRMPILVSDDVEQGRAFAMIGEVFRAPIASAVRAHPVAAKRMLR
jgi:hypothetical protein